MTYDPGASLESAGLDDLLVILLRQLRRLLAPIELTDAQIHKLVQHLPAAQPPDAQAAAIHDALIEVVGESEAVLARWNLSFATSLKTEMGDLPGWKSTAEFIDMANEKSNAELRIASASVLVTALGDLRYVPYLLSAIANDPQEVETVAARRVLAHLSGVRFEAANWLQKVQTWFDQQQKSM